MMLVLLLCGCGRTISQAPPAISKGAEMPFTPTPPFSPTRMTSPTWTFFPSPEPSITEKPAATETQTSTVEPPVALSENGPWLAMNDHEGMWVSNLDGTGLLQLINGQAAPIKSAIAPSGGRLAYFIAPPEPKDLPAGIVEMNVIQFPSLARQSIPLVTPPIAPQPGRSAEIQLNNLYAALVYENDLAWSPDGSLLAYAGILSGPSVDLFVYSPVDRTGKQLTSGPTQTIDISWSPGGTYIASSGALAMYWGEGGGSGPTIDSVWAVRPDGNDLHQIRIYPGGSIDPPHRIGWVNDHAYVDVYGNLRCGMYGLTFVDVQDSSHYSLVPGLMRMLAFDPNTGTVLAGVSVIPSGDQRYGDCGPKMDPGFYMISVFGGKAPQKLNLEAPQLNDPSNYFLEWSPTAKRFFTASNAGVSSIDLNGRVSAIDLSPQTFDVFWTGLDFVRASPAGTEWVLYNQQGLWLVSPNQPVRPIFTAGRVTDVLWLPDGSAFLFMSENVLYRYAEAAGEVEKLTIPISTQEYTSWKLSWIMP